jgi:DNA-binding NarL/FixJ family response regulator
MPIRVVLVDDSNDIRTVVRLALDRQGDFTVVAEAADGREAVTVVSEHQPHVVLLDISMPVMDGLQALPLLKRESPGSIVIMLTGISEAAGALSAVEQGAHGYIRKGGAMEDFLAQVREVLEFQFQRLDRGRPQETDPGSGSGGGSGLNW